eukprot:365296-Chlamydomonas_euryale.AAC.6
MARRKRINAIMKKGESTRNIEGRTRKAEKWNSLFHFFKFTGTWNKPACLDFQVHHEQAYSGKQPLLPQSAPFGAMPAQHIMRGIGTYTASFTAGCGRLVIHVRA